MPGVVVKVPDLGGLGRYWVLALACMALLWVLVATFVLGIGAVALIWAGPKIFGN